MFEYAPTTEEDVLVSLLQDDMFASGDVLLTSNPSDCRTRGTAKGNIGAKLYEAFSLANSENADSRQFDLLAHNPVQRVVDNSKTPVDWYYAERIPVVSISRVGIADREALVCVEIHSSRPVSYFVKLIRRTAKFWEVTQESIVWQAEEELPPEEVPELNIPEVTLERIR